MRLRAGLALALILLPTALPAAYTDVGLDSILQPRGTLDSGMVVVPLAAVRNYGTAPAVFDVRMMIGPGYSATVPVTLPAGASDVVHFPAWPAGPTGRLPVVAVTALAGDQNPSNDTAVGQVEVVRLPPHDLSTVDILSPPEVSRAGEIIAPRALVRNRGAAVERYFDVRFRIPPLYDRAVTVESLASNSSLEITFPDWTAVAGSYTASCSTQLASDSRPENDRQQVSIRVIQPLLLFVERDQSGHIRVAETRDFELYAEFQGDYGDVVSILPVAAPPGWGADLYDSTGTQPLADSDGDGIPDLGFLDPDTKRPFRLRVRARAALAGDTTGAAEERLAVRGFARAETLVTDSAVIALTLVPGFEIHNFPNPCDDATRFVIGLPGPGTVTLTVYERSGTLIARVLADRELGTGAHVFRWRATTATGERLAPGTYHYLLDYRHDGRSEQATGRLVVSRP